MGGGTASWTAIGTAACRVGASNTQPIERAIATSIQSVMTWTITFPQGTDCTAKDRILTGGRTFEVVAPAGPHAWDTCLRVICTEAK